MQPQKQKMPEKINIFLEDLKSKYSLNRWVIVLSVFLLVVLLISYIIPMVYFGRFFGTDDYTHLFHTKVMASSSGISDFYENIGTQVSNPGNSENPYNYPFGLWLFGATIAKITGIPLLSAELLFVILFLLILLGSSLTRLLSFFCLFPALPGNHRRFPIPHFALADHPVFGRV